MTRCLAMALAALLMVPWVAAAQTAETPVISIIVDDLGYQHEGGQRVVALPGPVACSVLPHTPYAQRVAVAAHRSGKEVLLHLPMQAMNDKDPGFGALTIDTGERELRRLLYANLDAVPHVVGVNNHMGSLLTRHPGHMAWLMQSLRQDPRELFFIDSVTSPQSVAYRLARENDVPSARRDLFLDRDPDPQAIAAQFDRLIALALARGSAVAIGHPYPGTLDVLERELPRLEARGVRLVSVAEFIRRNATESSPWHVSLSPSPRGSKN
ncbi:MAG: divergent polysaccharide deacetylase family protein [Gammaproteobacteria bacterium]|nr:divergent polysaccharide deacetylase family protein [Gammaproteobacteria bacterium]